MSESPLLPPYPADTRAKGWRFELDYEQIEQSSTWALAGPAGQAWALKLWLTAWRQVPCGSLPGDEEVIAAALGMTEAQWKRHRRALMRGWWAADDGRLYHETLTVRVLEMMAKRRSESDRKARGRARDSVVVPEEASGTPAVVPPVSRGTDAGLHPESDTDHRPPSSPASKKVSKASPSHPPSGGLSAGFDDFWLAWPKGERKQDKAKCLDHWRRNALHLKADSILADVRVKRGTQKWAEGFIEAPLVYLRGKRWEDGVEPEALRAPAVTVPRDPAAEAAALAQRERDREHAELAASPASIAARKVAVARLRGEPVEANP